MIIISPGTPSSKAHPVLFNKNFFSKIRLSHEPGISKSRVLFLSPNEREREKVCVLKIGALPSFVVVGINRSVRARARDCERREYYLKGN